MFENTNIFSVGQTWETDKAVIYFYASHKFTIYDIKDNNIYYRYEAGSLATQQNPDSQEKGWSKNFYIFRTVFENGQLKLVSKAYDKIKSRLELIND